MIFHTSWINKDVNFVQNNQNLQRGWCPFNTAFIQRAFECKAWNIFMYLLSFDNILLHDKIDHNRRYGADATEYIYQWLDDTINSKFEFDSQRENQMKMLIKHQNFQQKQFINRYGQTMLQYALNFNSCQVQGVKVSDIKHVDDNIRNRQSKVIDLVLSLDECNPFINYQSKDGNTALHIATSLGDVQLVEKLLKHKDVDINILNDQGYTPLMLVCEKASQGTQTDLQSVMVKWFPSIDGCGIYKKI